MGADEFRTRSKGATAEQAFRSAVQNAQYEHGHGGYSGTIAEKTSFKVVTPREGESPVDCVHRCLDDMDHFCQDKWGPAGCVEVVDPSAPPGGDRTFIFFGWASS